MSEHTDQHAGHHAGMSHLAKVLIAALAIALVGVTILFLSQMAQVQGRADAKAAEAERRRDECQKEADQLRNEVVALKQDLAKARQGSSAMALDSSVLALAPRSDTGGGSGALSQTAVVETVRNGKAALQSCYERALKRNTGLQIQQIQVTLGFTVQPSGRVGAVSIRPNYDGSMVDCMKNAIQRWKFPAFGGAAQEIQAPVTLSPKGA